MEEKQSKTNIDKLFRKEIDNLIYESNPQKLSVNPVAVIAVIYIVYMLIAPIVIFALLGSKISPIAFVIAVIISLPGFIVPCGLLFEMGEGHAFSNSSQCSKEAHPLIKLLYYIIAIVVCTVSFPVSIIYLLGLWRGKILSKELQQLGGSGNLYSYLPFVFAGAWIVLLASLTLFILFPMV